MSEPDRGHTASEIRDAQRLHEALIVKLAPAHTDKCAWRRDTGACDCPFLANALTAQTVAHHAPTRAPYEQPCAEHRLNLIMLTVPGFHCEKCTVAVELRCQQCGCAWPCADVRVAQNATGLDVPGAVDEFLSSLSAVS